MQYSGLDSCCKVGFNTIMIVSQLLSFKFLCLLPRGNLCETRSRENSTLYVIWALQYVHSHTMQHSDIHAQYLSRRAQRAMIRARPCPSKKVCSRERQ
eukprot:COSAG02_NODE_36_length_48934_cov_144.851029_8_plen_98_part_00